MRKLTMLLLTLLSFTGVVKAQEKVITNRDDLSNEKAYKIMGERGFIAGNEGYVMGSNNGPISNQTFDSENPSHLFAILKSADKYYLYNVGAKMFAAKSGNKASLTQYPVHTIDIVSANDQSTNYDWIIKLNNKYVNLSNSSENGVYTEYDTEDGGNRWSITEITDYTPTEALSVIEMGLAQERQDLYEMCLKAEAKYNSMSDKTITQVVELKAAFEEANEIHASSLATNKSISEAKESLTNAMINVDAINHDLLFEFDLSRQKFRLKNASTNLYMTIVEKESNNQDAGGVQIKTEGTDQYFYIVTTDEENKYKIKSTDDVYLTSFSSWGYKATENENDACKHAFGYIGDGKYTIESPLGFIGSNDNATSDGSVMYSNHDINKKNIFWILEPVYAAKVGDKGYITLSEALNAAKDGETVTLLKDVTASEIIVIDKAITLNGNNKTLTSTAGRAINVTGADGVTIQNIVIKANGERGINIIQNATNVTITGVDVSAKNYAVNAAYSAPSAIIGITGSTLSGLNVVNISSAGAQVTVSSSTLNCNDQNDSENYAALFLTSDATDAKITATDVTFNIQGDSYKAYTSAQSGKITIGDSEDDVIKAVALIEYANSYAYTFETLQGAIEYAEAGETVKLLSDVTLDEAVSVDKPVTLDFNGFNITRADGYDGYVFEVTGDLPMINGTLGKNIEKGATCYIINDNDYKTEEGKTFALTENQMVDIEYNRTFGHTDYQVLYVPFAIPFNNIKDDFDVYSIINISDVVELTQITDGTLEANVPYMIKAKEAGDKTIKVSYERLLSNPTEYTQVLGDYTITGTYTSKAIEEGQEYVLTNGEWCQLSETAVTNEQNILGAFRVYLIANEVAGNASVLRNVINGSDATAIDELKAEEGNNSKTAIYDLSGRRVEKAVKGVFIVNGKVVVK